MRNISNKVALKQKTAFTPRFDYIHIPLHGDTYGTDTATQADVQGNVLDSLISFYDSTGATATPTTPWTNAGQWTPDAAKVISTAQFSASDALRAFFRLDTLAELGGHFIVSFKMRVPDSAPAATCHVWDVGGYGTLADEGGFGMSLLTTRSLRFGIERAGGAFTSIGATAALTVATGYSVLLDLDFSSATPTGYVYLNAGTATSTALPSDGTGWPYLDTAARLSLGGRWTPTSTFAEIANATGFRMSDFLFIRATEDVTSEIAQLAQERYYMPREIPTILRA